MEDKIQYTNKKHGLSRLIFDSVKNVPENFLTERVDMLFKQFFSLLLFSQAAMICLTAGYLWNSEPRTILVSWLVFSLIVTLLMLSLIKHYKKKTHLIQATTGSNTTCF